MLTSILKTGTLTLLISLLSILSAGCKSITVIDSNKIVERLPKGKTYTPKLNGYFVPDSRMREILQQLEIKGHENEE